MLVLETPPFANHNRRAAPASPLNAVWRGMLDYPVILPVTGHLLLMFPAGGQAFSCAGRTVGPQQYLLQAPANSPVALAPLGDRPVSLLLVFLSPGFLADMADFIGLDDGLQPLLSGLPLPQGDALSALLAQLRDARAGIEQEELFLEIVGQILMRMRLRQRALARLDRHRGSTVADLLPRLLRARQFIAAHFQEPNLTRRAADHVGLSPFHFARLFRKAFEVTIHQFVVRLRLDAARAILATPEPSITAIALLVGYNSHSAFTNAFRKCFGRSPSAYRAAQRR